MSFTFLKSNKCFICTVSTSIPYFRGWYCDQGTLRLRLVPPRKYTLEQIMDASILILTSASSFLFIYHLCFMKRIH